tara:strand:- start:107 stop:703 length:597 start_codon:yes stop_codon:yes gene_type:complete
MKAKLEDIRDLLNTNNCIYTPDNPKNNSLDKDELRGPYTVCGAWNFWLENSTDDFGWKIYNSSWGQTESVYDEYDIIGGDELEQLFKFLQYGHTLGVFPKPIEIFKHKSVSGIKIQKANQITPDDDIWKNRRDQKNLQGLDKIFNGNNDSPDYYINYLFDDSGYWNWGTVDGNLVYLGINKDDTDRWIKPELLEKKDD